MTVVLMLISLAAGAWLLDRISAAPAVRAVPVSRRLAAARHLVEADPDCFEPGSVDFRQERRAETRAGSCRSK